MTALLLLNDHVLKAAYGNWVTGKLSDVAFLVVAPVVLAAALSWLGLADRRAKALAIGAVASFFVALQVWPSLGDAVASALGGRHTADLTDLLTLPALALLRVAWRPTPRIPMALPVSALACVATSYAYCPQSRFPREGDVIDPNAPLYMHFGYERASADHPGIARNVRVLDPDGVEVPLLFVDGIKICPQGGLEPDTTYLFVIDSIEPPGSNASRVWFNDTGTTSFHTLASSSRPVIATRRDCLAADLDSSAEFCQDTWRVDTAFDTGVDPDPADSDEPSDSGATDSGASDSGGADSGDSADSGL